MFEIKFMTSYMSAGNRGQMNSLCLGSLSSLTEIQEDLLLPKREFNGRFWDN